MSEEENNKNKDEDMPDVDLVMLIDAIRSSSAAELSVLGNISTNIAELKALLSKASKVDDKRLKMDLKRHREARRQQRQVPPPAARKSNKEKRIAESRPNEAELTIQPPVSAIPKLPDISDAIPADTAKPPQVDVSEIKQSTESIKNSTTKAMNELSKYWRDERGRLRKPNGQYASKDERAAYEKNAKGTAKEREEEKKNQVLTTLLSKGKDVISKTSETDAAEASGAAAGGTYFYAVKETFDLARSTKEKFDELKGGDDKEKGGIGAILSKLFKKKTTEPTKTEKSKEASTQRQQKELLQEQNAQQVRDAATTHRKLDDVVHAIKSANDEGMFDTITDLTSFIDDALDIGSSRDRSKGGKNKTKNKRGKGPRGSRGNNRSSRPKSILERARSGTQGVRDKVSRGGKGIMNAGKGVLGKIGGFAKSGLGIGSDLLKSVKPTSLMKIGGPLAAVLGGVDKFMSLKDDDSLSTEQKTAQVASTAAGGGMGTAIGTAIGATLGSVVPGFGTAIGGFVGGTIGGGIGTMLGSDIGEQISGFLGSDTSLGDYVSSAWDTASKGAGEMLDFASEGTEKALDKVSDVFDDVASALSDTKDTLASWWGDDDDEKTAGTQTKPVSEPVPAEPIIKLDQSTSIGESEKTKQLKESASNQTPVTVSLDQKSLQALKEAAGSQATVQTSNPDVTVKTAQSTGPTTDPDDFTTRELRRQAADLE